MAKARLEYKYYVPREIYPRILKDIAVFCRLDENSNRQGYYKISSVYFDTPALNCYFDRLDGNYRKTKFRLRSYNQDGAARSFVEMKHKVGDNNLKNKIEIDEKLAASLLNGRRNQDENNDVNSDYFQKILKINDFFPFIQISYKRIAFFYRHYQDLRLTFDSEIKCRRFKNANGVPHIPIIPSQHVILEIKSRRQLPWWLLLLIKKYNLQKRSISKYLLSVQSLALNSSFCLK